MAMTFVDKKQVRKSLEAMGLHRLSEGKGGHEVWEDPNGRTVSASFHGRKDISIALLYAMGQEMEGKGIMGRQEFIQRVKGRA